MRLRSFQPGEETELWELSRQQHAAVPVTSDSDQAHWAERLRVNQPFIVEYDHQVIGYAECSHNGEIGHFFVRSEWHGRGVGTFLMVSLHQYASARGVERLCVQVSHASRPFFERRGFDVDRSEEGWARMSKRLAV